MTNQQAYLICFAIMASAGAICASVGTGAGILVGLVFMLFGLVSFFTTRLQ